MSEDGRKEAPRRGKYLVSRKKEMNKKTNVNIEFFKKEEEEEKPG